MAVFISHSSKDDVLAREAYNRLTTTHKIKCYIDDFDYEAKIATDITKHICDKIVECSHLLAIVTDKTKTSWWVPFEIGVARQAPRMIASCSDIYYGLPDFIKEWPVLKGIVAIDKFAALYKKQPQYEQIIEKRSYELEYASRKNIYESVDFFHKELKKQLNQ